MKLVMGVDDVAYSDARGGGAETTAEVARILEDKYHVMETFYEARADKIAGWLAEDMTHQMSMMFAGKPQLRPRDVFYTASRKIDAAFRTFLTRNEMGMLSFLDNAERDYALAHIPRYTGAANAGVSHRKKHPYAGKNKARPVFVDTGLYRQTFLAWVE